MAIMENDHAMTDRRSLRYITLRYTPAGWFCI